MARKKKPAVVYCRKCNEYRPARRSHYVTVEAGAMRLYVCEACCRTEGGRWNGQIWLFPAPLLARMRKAVEQAANLPSVNGL